MSRRKKQEITVGFIIDKFIEYYVFALKNKSIDKPLSWALYRMWEVIDKCEESRTKHED